MAQVVKNKPACNAGDLSLIPGLGRSWRREWQPTPVLLPGESHGQRSLVGYSLWGHKQLDMTERLSLSPVTIITNVHSNWLSTCPNRSSTMFHYLPGCGCPCQSHAFPASYFSGPRAPSPKSNDISDKGIVLLTAFKGKHSEPF